MRPGTGLFGLLVWLLAFVASAQTIALRHYAHDQGLLGLAGTCLLQTSHTPLWVCTENGLYRFDGQDFRQVALDGERGLHLDAMSQDAAGRIWVAGSGSLFVGDERGFRKLDYTETGHLHQTEIRLASTDWATLLVSDGQVLRLQPRADGRWRLQPLFDAATLARRPELGRIVGAFADGDTLWLGCARMLCRVDARGEVETLGPDQGVPDDRWYSVAHDRDGALWARGQRQVIQRPAGAARFEPRPLPGPEPAASIGRVPDIAADHQGRILVARNNTLARWEDGRWRLFDRRNGLPEGSAVTLRVDRGSGDLWMNIDGESLVRWAGYDWIENWDASQGMVAAPTWSIARDAEGRLLLGNEHGVSLQRNPGDRFEPWLALAGAQVIGLQRSVDGSLWSANSSGLLAQHRPGGDGRRVAQLPQIAKRMFLDREGRLWGLTTTGLFLLEHPGSGEAPHRVEELPAIAYQDIQQTADGTLWVASARGVYRFRDGRWTPLRLRIDGREVQRWVSKLRVLPDGELWLAFYQPGVWHGALHGDDVELRRADDALLAELTVYVMHLDRAGRLWIGHNRGVDVRAKDGRWSRLSQSQGLLWDDTSEGAILEDPDGSVWLGNSKGVSHILDPGRLFDAAAPRLEISAIRRGDAPIAPGARLPWSDRPLHVELTALGIYDDPSRVRFRYRLAGLHREWVYTRSPEIEQPPLPAGRYVFEAQLLDEYRRSASAPARIAFEVAPRWWAGWPALAVYAALAALLLTATWRWRHRQLLQRERTLARLVAERTVELEREKRELESARAALALKATHDDLTGLLNRAGILDVLGTEMTAVQAGGQPLAVVLIDLDHFKQINDQYGHLTGDGVLARVGRRLDACLRDSDRVGRYGGEELLAILPGLAPAARNRLHALHDAIRAAPYGVDGQTLQVTCSIGVAWYRPGETAEQLLGRADAALYRAKRSGRDRIELEP